MQLISGGRAVKSDRADGGVESANDWLDIVEFDQGVVDQVVEALTLSKFD